MTNIFCQGFPIQHDAPGVIVATVTGGGTPPSDFGMLCESCAIDYAKSQPQIPISDQPAPPVDIPQLVLDVANLSETVDFLVTATLGGF